jgi:hypothetical protein
MARLSAWPKCEHGLRICSRCVTPSDAGKRIHDAIGLAITFHKFDEIRHSWMRFTLEDGNTDHVLYPRKIDAVRKCSNENLYCFVFLGNCPAGMSAKDATLWIMFNRHAIDSGMTLTEPNVDMIFPLARGASGNWHSRV